MKAILYAFCSVKGTPSISNQIQEITAYAKQKEYEIVDICSEECPRVERTVFDQVVARILAGEADCLVVRDGSVITRKLADWRKLYEQFRKAGKKMEGPGWNWDEVAVLYRW